MISYSLVEIIAEVEPSYIIGIIVENGMQVQLFHTHKQVVTIFVTKVIYLKRNDLLVIRSRDLIRPVCAQPSHAKIETGELAQSLLDSGG